MCTRLAATAERGGQEARPRPTACAHTLAHVAGTPPTRGGGEPAPTLLHARQTDSTAWQGHWWHALPAPSHGSAPAAPPDPPPPHIHTPQPYSHLVQHADQVVLFAHHPRHNVVLAEVPRHAQPVAALDLRSGQGRGVEERGCGWPGDGLPGGGRSVGSIHSAAVHVLLYTVRQYTCCCAQGAAHAARQAHAGCRGGRSPAPACAPPRATSPSPSAARCGRAGGGRADWVVACHPNPAWLQAPPAASPPQALTTAPTSGTPPPRPALNLQHLPARRPSALPLVQAGTARSSTQPCAPGAPPGLTHRPRRT